MSINAVSYLTADIYYKTQAASKEMQNKYKREAISQDLQNKLLELGLAPEKYTTVDEAKAAIRKAENEKESKNQNSDSKGSNSSLRAEIEELAAKIGVKISEDDTNDEILDNIKSAVESLIKLAVSKNDEGLYNKAKEFESELMTLEVENEGGGFANLAVINFMDLLAEQNKMQHGIK